MIPVLIRGFLLFQGLSAFTKIAFGVVSATAVYYLLNNTIRPKIDELQNAVLSRVDDLGSIAATVSDVLIFLDFVNLLQIVFSTTTVLLMMKIYLMALRAFGINTGE